MAYEVLMPQLGLTMEEGTVSQWIKHEGDEEMCIRDSFCVVP